MIQVRLHAFWLLNDLYRERPEFVALLRNLRASFIEESDVEGIHYSIYSGVPDPILEAIIAWREFEPMEGGHWRKYRLWRLRKRAKWLWPHALEFAFGIGLLVIWVTPMLWFPKVLALRLDQHVYWWLIVMLVSGGILAYLYSRFDRLLQHKWPGFRGKSVKSQFKVADVSLTSDELVDIVMRLLIWSLKRGRLGEGL